MAGVTKPQIEQARKMSLVEYLQRTNPNELVARTHDYTTRTHDSLIIAPETTPDKMVWHWTSHHIGGKGALDYLMKVQELPFVDAVRTVIDGTAIAQDVPMQPAVKTKERKPFARPIATDSPTAAVAYLRNRGIHPAIIDQCIAKGIVYEEREHHNVVFVGEDSTGKARYACQRGTYGNFKNDVEGSEKNYGFCIPAYSAYSNVVSVFESPIDAMSQASLRKMHPSVCATWNDRYFLSLGGTAGVAVLQFLRDHPLVDTVHIATDNDHAGRTAAVRIMDEIGNDSKLGLQVKHIYQHVPDIGKDWNDVLLHHVAQAKERKQEKNRARVSQER